MRIPPRLLHLLFAALPLSAAAQTPRPPEVVEIDFEGVHVLDPALLRAVITTREPRCRSALLTPACALGLGRERALLDSAAVRRDEARIDSAYAAAGFPRTRTTSEVEPSGGGAVVRFRVAEGPPLVVRSIEVRGLEALPQRISPPLLPLRVGDPYSLARLEASQRLLTRAAAEQGYAFARVEVGGAISPDTADAQVVLEVVPGPRGVFGPTIVQANSPFREGDVRARLAYRVGEPFRPEALDRTVSHLYDLPIVEAVRLVPRPAPGADSVVEVEALVRAGKPGEYGVDAVVSGSSCIGGSFNLTSRYFLGAPREVSVSAGASNLFARALRGFPCTGATAEDEFNDPNYSATVSLREPVGTEGRLLVDASAERTSAARAYVRRGVRGRIGYSRLLGHGFDALLAVAPERSDNEAAAPFFCALRGECAGAGLAALTGSRTLVPVELGAGWRSGGPQRLPPGPRLDTIPGVAPLRWRSSARLSVAGAGAATGSELAFGRTHADVSVQRFLGPRLDVILRGRAGALLGGGDALPPHLRFYGGGPTGVRGVQANLLGPRLLVVRDDEEDEIGCALAAGACEGITVDRDRVYVRGAGGVALVEATVEGRVWATQAIQLAAFVDFGAVRGGAENGSPLGSRTEALVTPGIGIGLVTPIAPVRIDLAYNPAPVRRYPLLARDPDGDGYIPLGNVVFDPLGGATGWERFRRRVQVQFSLTPGF